VYTPPVRKKWQANILVNLILKKISKIGATRCQILRLKCTKIDFGWGSSPYPAGGAYSAPPDPLAVFKGPTSKGKDGEGEERKEKEGKGKGRDVADVAVTVEIIETVPQVNHSLRDEVQAEVQSSIVSSPVLETVLWCDNCYQGQISPQAVLQTDRKPLYTSIYFN